MNATFSPEEQNRYDRHFKLPWLGPEGQARLKAARLLCVGLGGLGAPACLYLAAAGIGTLGLMDEDIVELANLQRQILYRTGDIGSQKVTIAQNQLASLNPSIQIITHPERLTGENAKKIISNYDIILDGSDNFKTHYLINDICHALKKPSIWAVVTQSQGRCSVFNTPEGPCYRCLFQELPPNKADSCSEAGVLGVLPGLLGIIQATEVIKLAAKIGRPLIGRVLSVDILNMDFKEYYLKKNPECVLCSGAKGNNIKQEESGDMNTINNINIKDLQKLLAEQPDDICILDVRRPDEYAICNIQGQLIPLAELPDRLDELDKNKHIIVHCKSGGRSLKASELLMQAGFERVSNLTGGIMAWIDTVDPSLTKY